MPPIATAPPSSGSRPLPRLALVSPLPPQRSGVASYAAELAPALAAHYAVDLVCDDAAARDAWSGAGYAALDAETFAAMAGSYDRILYQLGNSNAHRWMFELLPRHPGAVTLHDVFLSGVLADMDTSSYREGIWFEALYRDHGWGPAAERYLHPDPFAVIRRYPCCGAALFDSRGVVVHSQEARAQIRLWYGDAPADAVHVIPHLRAPAPEEAAAAAGAELGFAEDDFVVCSFGGLGPAKLNLRLLDAFAASALGADPRCRLVFVGGELTSDDAAKLQRAVAAYGLASRVRLTGWVEPAVYAAWLRRADLAVQLRAHSRGESSGAVMDCWGAGAPVLVNAHGSMGELPADAAWRLPDAFADAELAEALERLRADAGLRARLAEAGRRRVRAEHAPAAVAARYADAIEQAYARAPATAPAPPRLLVDVSALARHDLRTGIERVSRALVRAWIADPPAGLRVEPVRADADGLALARAWTARLLGLPRVPAPDAPACPRAGDVYVMPDLDHAGVTARRDAYRAMRRAGVRTAFLVHDLLPITHPGFFPAHAARDHAAWLAVVAEADIAVCPSRAVADDLRAWLAAHAPERAGGLRIVTSHHGADLHAAPADQASLSRGDFRLLARLSGARAVLMVGTVEPRKGHADVLDAFERLWAAGGQDVLVIAGRPGWMVDDLLARLRGHPERGKRLVHLEDAGDALLEQLYLSCGCLLMASHAEGFGLPLVEAVARGCGVIARDLPVFREIAGDRALYFQGGGEALAEAIARWRRLDRRGEAPRPGRASALTWAQSARTLGRLLTAEP